MDKRHRYINRDQQETLKQMAGIVTKKIELGRQARVLVREYEAKLAALRQSTGN